MGTVAKVAAILTSVATIASAGAALQKALMPSPQRSQDAYMALLGEFERCISQRCEEE